MTTFIFYSLIENPSSMLLYIYAVVKGRECLILQLGHAQQSPGLQHVLCWEKYHQSVRFFSSRSNLHSVGKLVSGTVK
jgi:hypothetical protein